MAATVVLTLFAILAAVTARSKSPLIDEADTRMVNKAAECVFGSQIKDLGSSWIPDLGPPINVLYCTRCECVKTQRKKRIVARVQCRSIKEECPEPTCAEPKLEPGNCCKTCPGEPSNEALQDIIPKNVAEEEEKNSKHYAALLTGRSSLVLRNDDNKPIPNDNKNNVVATGRFNFHRRSLYYSFYISDRAARPYRLQFVDPDANILEEITLSEAGGSVNSVYQNATRKVCGVWKRLPRDYRRLLKDERLFVVLVWGATNEFMLSGQIKRYAALDTELFSSLMEPAPGTTSMQGAGGTGIIYTSTSLTPSIHVAIVFNGLFEANETKDVPVEITLMDERKIPILKEIRIVSKPALDLNLVELSTVVSGPDLRSLTRGRLLLTVASLSRPHSLKLVGNIMTKTTCELFQTLLVPPQGDTTGLAWMYLNNEGYLVYNIQIDGLGHQKPDLIVLSDMSTKRKVELLDITSSYHNGWANGTQDKITPKIIEPLYSGNLWVSVAKGNYSMTKGNFTMAKGKLVPKLVADARDAPAPILLRRESNVPSSAVGLAWINVDNMCNLHYDVTLSGLGHPGPLDVYLEMLPMIAPGAPVIPRHLGEIVGGNLDGSTNDILRREELRRLDSGVAFLKIKDKSSRHNLTLLAATLKQIKVPATCLPQLTDDNNVGLSHLDANEDNMAQNGGDCFHGGRFYTDEASWTSALNPCEICVCRNGQIKCDTAKCPPLNCPNGQRLHPGDCCPVCIDNDDSFNDDNTPRRCQFGGRTYGHGARFHPYLIQTGFDECIWCTCKATRNETEVQCARIQNEKCCPTCNHPAVVDSMNGSMIGDRPRDAFAHHRPHHDPIQETKLRAAKIMSEGGCENPNDSLQPYKNQQVYHPVIASLGEYKCVTCKCDKGVTKCERPQCTREMCDKSRKARRVCCKRDCIRYRHKNKNQRAKGIR